MKDYLIKFRHIMPVFFYVTVGSIIGVASLRYMLAIQTDVLDLKREIWQIWIPLIFPWIPITIWLRPRIRILIFRKYTDRRQFAFQVIAYATITISMIISQMYLTTATGRMQEVVDIEELDRNEVTTYYRIQNFQTISAAAAVDEDVRASGKHNQHLDFKFYFVYPMVTDSLAHQTGRYKFWYGIKFQKTISNRLPDEEKKTEWNKFYDECFQELAQYQFHDYTYLERIPNSDDRDGFLRAVARATQNGEGEFVILTPSHEVFENRNGNKLFWIFGSYFIGTSVFLLVLLWPRLSRVELDRQLTGRKPKDDDVVEMFKFLIPAESHISTSIILDLNVLVFLIMTFAGVHILSPNAAEVFAWGGVRRTEVMSGEWWRLITCMFVHGGIVHLIFNMFGLILAYSVIEPLIGAAKFAILFFVSGISASISSIAWHENTVSVGASGAIFGLFGAILAVTLFTGMLSKYGKRMTLWLFAPYVVINLVMGIRGNIDNAAHIGGLLAGAVTGLIIFASIKDSLTEEGEETL